MPKAEVGTQKWLANRMKAKGLQRLKWFCQMCNKQCRDENGFKCHKMSEVHQRQMKIFAQTPDSFMDEFSQDFERSFMRLMSTTYCRTRVFANTVYCDLISDKNHVHMNSTIWVTLSEFVQYLSRSGKCKVERTERGWFLEYIDKEKIKRDAESERKRKIELSDNIRHSKRLEAAVNDAKSSGRFQDKNDVNEEEYLLKREEGQSVSFKIPAKDSKRRQNEISGDPESNNLIISESTSSGIIPADDISVASSYRRGSDNDSVSVVSYQSSFMGGGKRKVSTIDKLMLENEKKKNCFVSKNVANITNVSGMSPTITEDRNKSNWRESEMCPNRHNDADADWWLAVGLVVKVKDETLQNGIFMDEIGEVVKIAPDDEYSGEVLLATTKDRLMLDQDNLEPVIPNIGRTVMLIKGEWRGHIGNLVNVNDTADVQVFGGPIFAAKLTPHTLINVSKIKLENICQFER